MRSPTPSCCGSASKAKVSASCRCNSGWKRWKPCFSFNLHMSATMYVYIYFWAYGRGTKARGKDGYRSYIASRAVLSSRVYLSLHYHISYFISSYLILSHPILPHLILSCLISSSLILISSYLGALLLSLHLTVSDLLSPPQPPRNFSPPICSISSHLGGEGAAFRVRSHANQGPPGAIIYVRSHAKSICSPLP